MGRDEQCVFSASYIVVWFLIKPDEVFDFYTNLNEFYGVVTECCTQQSCVTMSAGPTCVRCRVFPRLPNTDHV